MSRPKHAEHEDVLALQVEVANLRASLAAAQRALQAQTQNLNGGHLLEATPGQFESIFPPEVFLLVARFMKSRSQTLLRLASTCRHLFALLLPRVLEHIDSDVILNPHFIHYRRTKLQVFRSHVKSIELFPVHLDTSLEESPALVPATRELLEACSETLCRLSINMSDETGLTGIDPTTFESSLFPREPFPNLHELDLVAAPERLPRWLPSRFPNVRKLDIHQCLHNDDVFDLDVWRSIAKLPHLEELSFRLGTHHAGLATLPELVSKIREITVTCSHCLMALLRVPFFQPSAVLFDEGEIFPEDEEESIEMWTLLTRIDKLKRIAVPYAFPADLLFQLGFPKNLETFHAFRMKICDNRRDFREFEKLRDRLPKSLTEIRISLFVDSVPDKDTSQWYALLQELLFWDSIVTPLDAQERMEVVLLPVQELAEEFLSNFEFLRDLRAKV